MILTTTTTTRSSLIYRAVLQRNLFILFFIGYFSSIVSSQCDGPMPPMASLGDVDFELCEGYGMVLSPVHKNFADCGNGDDDITYLWSTGETTPFININQPGQYSVTLTSCDGCQATALANVFKDNDCDSPDPDCADFSSEIAEGGLPSGLRGSLNLNGNIAKFVGKENSNLSPTGVWVLNGYNDVQAHWQVQFVNYASVPDKSDDNFFIEFSEPICGLELELSGFTANGDANWGYGRPELTFVIYDTDGNEHFLDRDEINFNSSTSLTYESPGTIVSNRIDNSLIRISPDPNIEISKFEIRYEDASGNTAGKYVIFNMYPVNGCQCPPVSSPCDGPMPPMASLGDVDFELCEGYGMVLSPVHKNFADCGNGDDDITYLWSTGETTPFININQPGQYSVTLTSCDGCQATALANVFKDNDCDSPDPDCADFSSEIAEGGLPSGLRGSLNLNGNIAKFVGKENSNLSPTGVWVLNGYNDVQAHWQVQFVNYASVPDKSDDNFFIEFSEPICGLELELSGFTANGDANWGYGRPELTFVIYDTDGNEHFLDRDEINFNSSTSLTYESPGTIVSNRIDNSLIRISPDPNIEISKFEIRYEDASGNTAGKYVIFNMYPVNGCQCAPLSIGSTVFVDKNDDGIQNNGDPGLANVKVELYKMINGVPTIETSIMTDDQGNYFFEELNPAIYQVKAIPKGSNPISSKDIATTSLTDVDGDDNGFQSQAGLAVTSASIIMERGVQPINGQESYQGGSLDDLDDTNGNMTIDFGFRPNLSIGNLVFYDIDNNGIFDKDIDEGIEGVEVSLFVDTDSDGIADTQIGESLLTDNEGLYFFGDLVEGDYEVRVVPPYKDAVVTIISNQDNKDGNNDGKYDGDIVKSDLVQLNFDQEPSGDQEEFPGEELDDDNDSGGNMTVDFGFVPNILSIGSTVFLDINDNSVQDAAELGLENVRVKLYRVNGSSILGDLVGEALTDVNGDYFFGNLSSGLYRVVVSAPAGAPMSSSNALVPTDDNVDNNDDGIQVSPGEDAMSPIISLFYNDEPVGTEESGSGGTQDDALGDSNGNMTVDFGFVPKMSVGSTVFLDNNDNGVQDSTEPGIENVTVKLYETNSSGVLGDLVAEVVTDVNGDYLIDNLLSGLYRVVVSAPAGAPMSSSNALVPTDDNVDNNDDGIQVSPGDDAMSPIISLSYNDEPVGTEESGSGGTQDDALGDSNGNMTVDFGFIPKMSVGSTVWLDINNDGIQNNGETGIEGATVRLYVITNGFSSQRTLVDTDQTDATGLYYFDELLPGEYQVDVEAPSEYPLSSVPTNATDDGNDSDDNGTQDKLGDNAISPIISLVYNEEPVGSTESGSGGNQDDAMDANGDMTVDFGFVPVGSIGSTVFADYNNDGFQNVSEPGIPNVRVLLYKNSNVLGSPIASQTTDSEGLYYFESLLPGEYKVIVEAPADYPLSSTITNVSDDGIDGDDNGIQSNRGEDVMSPVINLSNNEVVGTQESAIGGDQDQEADEYGDMTVDFGFVPNLSLGSTIFADVNNDGIMQPGENGINGIQVTLRSLTDATFTPVSIMTSTQVIEGVSQSGLYFVDNLLPGTYYIEGTFSPVEYSGVSDNSFLPDSQSELLAYNRDNDNNGTLFDQGIFRSESITLVGGDEPFGVGESGLSGGSLDGNDSSIRDKSGNMTLDVGLIPQAAAASDLAVGNFTFYDKNDNGVFDGDDEALGGISLSLYSVEIVASLGDVSDTTYTFVSQLISDNDGFYQFTDLTEGLYQVRATPNPDYPHSSGEALAGNYKIGTASFIIDYGNVKPPISSDSDSDIDDVDDGVQDGNYGIVRSGIFALISGQEPGFDKETGQGGSNDDGLLTEDQTNLTIDFGFTRRDKDNDLLFDHEEDANKNGDFTNGETDYCNPDTDGDRIIDGVELGRGEFTDQTRANGTGGNCITNIGGATVCFVDMDPNNENTDPLKSDTDGDGKRDGTEDDNYNGKIDTGETDPNDPNDFKFNSVSASVLLEGALVDITSQGAHYNDRMNTKLNRFGLLPGQEPTSVFGTKTPAGQPYNIEPWVYNLDDGMKTYEADIVDWVLLIVRMGMDKETNVCVGSGLLHSNGTISFPDESYNCDLVDGQSYHIVVMHRNHLPVISPLVTAKAGRISYDFRTKDSYRFGFNKSQKKLADGRYVMFSGNALQKGKREMADLNVGDDAMWKKEFGLFDSYLCSDLDMNGSTEPNDRAVLLLNYGLTSTITN